MRTLVNVLAIIGSVLALLCTLSLYIGVISDAFTGPQGMVILFFQLWGAIGVSIALIFGFAGRVIDRRVPKPASRFSNGSIAVGLLCGALILAMPFVFG
ncbi:MAG: hypothetical protein AAFP97_12775 [Pseudomonadota bacterium]